MSEMLSMKPTTCARALCGAASDVVHHPTRGLIIHGYFRLVQCILYRPVEGVALKVSVGLKPGMHVKDTNL